MIKKDEKQENLLYDTKYYYIKKFENLKFSLSKEKLYIFQLLIEANY